MKRAATAVIALLFSAIVMGQGIDFKHTSFDKVCKTAQRENKLIFADVYTKWCGPCYRMAKEVFVREEVGELVNKHFVSVKIDAETDEGRKFTKEYPVKSFPTYLFIDPKTRKLVHVSGSYHTAEDFMKIVTNALNPEKRSFYLTKQYEEGNRDTQFLLDYMDYLKLSYKTAELTKVIKQFTELNNLDLGNKQIGELFFEYINDRNHPMFRSFMKKRDKMEQLYGKERVEAKIYQAYRWYSNTAELESIKDFKGKEYILEYNKLSMLIKHKDYAGADRQVMSIINNPKFDKEEVKKDIEYFGHRAIKAGADAEWLMYCVKHLQYLAYNYPDRQDASLHYNYARILEKIIKDNPEIHKYFPKSVYDAPESGKMKYSLRPLDLASKPSRKRIKK